MIGGWIHLYYSARLSNHQWWTLYEVNTQLKGMTDNRSCEWWGRSKGRTTSRKFVDESTLYWSTARNEKGPPTGGLVCRGDGADPVNPMWKGQGSERARERHSHNRSPSPAERRGRRKGDDHTGTNSLRWSKVYKRVKGISRNNFLNYLPIGTQYPWL